MKHGLLISAAAAVALCAAATPAVAGIVGNTSFSHEIPVPVPAGAQTPQVRTGSDTPASSTPTARTTAPAPRSSTRSTRAPAAPTPVESTHHNSASRSEPEPGEDGGRRRTSASHTPGRNSGRGNSGGNSTDNSGRGGGG